MLGTDSLPWNSPETIRLLGQNRQTGKAKSQVTTKGSNSNDMCNLAEENEEMVKTYGRAEYSSTGFLVKQIPWPLC